jgi:hypothetical protein
MTRNRKLVDAIRNNPRDVRFDDACRVAEMIGFVHKGGSGSHRSYSRSGEPVGLNFQDRNGKIPTYQAKQLSQMIDIYWVDE